MFPKWRQENAKTLFRPRVQRPPAAIGRVNLSTVNGQLHILQAHQRHLWNCCHCYSYHCTDSDCRAVFLIVQKKHRVSWTGGNYLYETYRHCFDRVQHCWWQQPKIQRRRKTILLAFQKIHSKSTCSGGVFTLHDGWKNTIWFHGKIQVLRKWRNHSSNFQSSHLPNISELSF